MESLPLEGIITIPCSPPWRTQVNCFVVASMILLLTTVVLQPNVVNSAFVSTTVFVSPPLDDGGLVGLDEGFCDGFLEGLTVVGRLVGRGVALVGLDDTGGHVHFADLCALLFPCLLLFDPNPLSPLLLVPFLLDPFFFFFFFFRLRCSCPFSSSSTTSSSAWSFNSASNFICFFSRCVLCFPVLSSSNSFSSSILTSSDSAFFFCFFIFFADFEEWSGSGWGLSCLLGAVGAFVSGGASDENGEDVACPQMHSSSS